MHFRKKIFTFTFSEEDFTTTQTGQRLNGYDSVIKTELLPNFSNRNRTVKRLRLTVIKTELLPKFSKP